MNRIERRERILEAIHRTGSSRVSDLAAALSVSFETVRRELKHLQDEGLIDKRHGVAQTREEVSEGAFDARLKEQAEAKQRIGIAASECIPNGVTLFIDGGTTSFYVARQLARRSDLTVITNSLPVATEMARGGRNRILICGGAVDADYQAMYDHTARDFLVRFTTDITILSIGAIDLDFGLMDYHPGEAAISEIAIANARQMMLVADSSKFGRRALVKVAPISAVGILVTEAGCPESVQSAFATAERVFV